MPMSIRSYKTPISQLEETETFSLDELDPDKDVDPNLDFHRVITTLDPQKIPLSTESVMDISGLTGSTMTLDGRKSSEVHYTTVKSDGEQHNVAFPPAAVGVYYFKQSTVSPTCIGELRFRLCRTVQDFARGKDLCLPSGSIWHLSTRLIHTTAHLKGLRDFLQAEGLFEGPVYPYRIDSTAAHPLVLNNPFVIDLSVRDVQFAVPHSTHSLTFYRLARNPKNPKQHLFRGRIVVQLEEYPGLPTGDISDIQHPLLALRVLEHLTPIERLTDDDYMQFPQPGEFLTVRRKGGPYIPWGYGTSKPISQQIMLDLLAESRSKQNV